MDETAGTKPQGPEKQKGTNKTAETILDVQGPEKQKGTNKTAETILDVLGAVGTVAGPLIFGPDFQADLGSPFKTAAEKTRQSRVSRGLMDVLNQHPETAQFANDAQQITAMGGLPAALGIGAQQKPDIREYLQDPNTMAKIMNVDPTIGTQLMGSIAMQKPESDLNQLYKMFGIAKMQKDLARDPLEEKRQIAEMYAKIFGEKKLMPTLLSTFTRKTLKEAETFDASIQNAKAAINQDLFKDPASYAAIKNYIGQKALKGSDVARAELQKLPNGAQLLSTVQALDMFESEFRKSMTGLAGSIPEMKNYGFITPKAFDDPAVIEKSLANFEVIRNYKTFDALLQAQAAGEVVDKLVSPNDLAKFKLVKQYYKNPQKNAKYKSYAEAYRKELNIAPIY